MTRDMDHMDVVWCYAALCGYRVRRAGCLQELSDARDSEAHRWAQASCADHGAGCRRTAKWAVRLWVGLWPIHPD
jgi:hypothetical protein